MTRLIKEFLYCFLGQHLGGDESFVVQQKTGLATICFVRHFNITVCKVDTIETKAFHFFFTFCSVFKIQKNCFCFDINVFDFCATFVEIRGQIKN